jgi:hypothetical protein
MTGREHGFREKSGKPGCIPHPPMRGFWGSHGPGIRMERMRDAGTVECGR